MNCLQSKQVYPNDTSKKHDVIKVDELVNHIWSVNRNENNLKFYVNTYIYRQLTRCPTYMKLCIDFNLSVGYRLHSNVHPITMNYYNPDSDNEFISDSEDEDAVNDSDIMPLLKQQNISPINFPNDIHFKREDDTTPLLLEFSDWKDA